MDIGGSKTQFTLPFFEEELARNPRLVIPDNIRCTIRRAIIDDKDMESLSQLKYGIEDIYNVLPLVISRYDNYLFQLPVYVIDVQR